MSPGQIGGWIGGMVGLMVGIAGGIVGSYFSIKNTNGPLERAFMVKSVTVVWVLVILFFGLLIALPNPYRWLMWIPYSILLPVGIIYGNKRQQAIRQIESKN